MVQKHDYVLAFNLIIYMSLNIPESQRFQVSTIYLLCWYNNAILTYWTNILPYLRMQSH
jgi:hypothetical protein